ncbi:MAG: alpha/beta hydrolase [Candidatus Heimdallarchaeota archaeon]
MRRKKEDLCSELEKKANIAFYEMTDGTKIRVLEFDFAKNPNKYTLLFIPGFATVFQSWQEVLEPLSKEFRILYFESREKNSSIMPTRKIERNINLHKMAYDIKETFEQMGLKDQNYITVCSSTGGTIEIEALSEKWISPNGAVMVGPTVEYHLSLIAPLLVSIVPKFVKNLFTPIFRWYVGKIYVDKKENPEQYAKYVRAGEEIKLRKVRKILWQMTKYKCWDMLPKIGTKCLLVGASSDKMHATEETKKTHELIPNSAFIDLGSNKATHSQPLVDAIKSFTENL